jgi:DNA-binding NarL/FixJ family response regulator
MINILVADDQNFVRKTLESYLEAESDLQIVGFAKNGEVAIAKVAELKPDIVLMDIEMPIMDGFAATETIAQKYADTKVLMLSIHNQKQDVARALKLGAKGYWLKNTTAKELANAIRHVHKGYFQLALDLVDKHFAKTVPSDLLPKQELELSHKLSMVDAVLAKIEQKIDFIEGLTPSSLNETLEMIVKQEMSLKKEDNDNLQFKFDRLKQHSKRFEQKTNLAIRVLLISNFILFLAILVLSYSIFIT